MANIFKTINFKLTCLSGTSNMQNALLFEITKLVPTSDITGSATKIKPVLTKTYFYNFLVLNILNKFIFCLYMSIFFLYCLYMYS